MARSSARNHTPEALLDFVQGEIAVREGKGMKDRVTMLPGSVVPTLQEHLRRVKAIHQQDLAQGRGWVALPSALARKYPNATRKWGWQYVFPATSHYRDAESGEWRRPFQIQKKLFLTP